MKKEDDLLYWLWLSLACRPGSALPSTLLKYFGSPEKIYEASKEDYRAVDTPFYGHEKDLADKSTERAESVLDYCRKNGVGVMTPDDYFYPEKFRVIPAKPIVVYYIGNFCDFDERFCAAVVGARRPSNYAIHAAKRVSLDLARSGAVIVSGLAKGIDAAAHKAALYNGSFTAGVLGCGIDRVYPKENEALYREVMEKGLVMTEYPPGTAPLQRNFPVRNRLIAGLSDAVCVIEGSEVSGALYTAEDAMRQKKPVYTVPGSIFSSAAAGSNFLLKIGAKPLLSAYDVIDGFQKRFPELRGAVEEFRNEDRAEKKREKNESGVRKKISRYVFAGLSRAASEQEVRPPQYEFIPLDEAPLMNGQDDGRAALLTKLDEDERTVLGRLGFEPVPVDLIVDDTLSTSAVLAILTKLEIKGLVHRMPGGRYALADRAEA